MSLEDKKESIVGGYSQKPQIKKKETETESSNLKTRGDPRKISPIKDKEELALKFEKLPVVKENFSRTEN